MLPEPDWILPDWPAPAHVKALSTTRRGGVSGGRYGLAGGVPGGLNLGAHVGDDLSAVAANRARLARTLPAVPRWLEQVHGCAVSVEQAGEGGARPVPNADASMTSSAGVVCVVMTADCLPVLLCDSQGSVIGAAHAGWRGLCEGVLETTLARMAAGAPGASGWMAWLGPAIGPSAFEVGPEVRDAFLAKALPGEREAVDAAFLPAARAGADAGPKYLADIYALARIRLARAGCRDVHGGDACTVGDAQRFYSYRRDGVTGRMASLIWLEGSDG